MTAVGTTPSGKRVVRAARLRVHEHDPRVAAEVQVRDRHQVDVQVGEHGAVLGAADDAPSAICASLSSSSSASHWSAAAHASESGRGCRAAG
jgi:hypothetical protein